METANSTEMTFAGIDMMADPLLPVPLSGVDDGGVWRTQQYVFTWQNTPETVAQRAAKVLGKAEAPVPFVYRFAMMAFDRKAGQKAQPIAILAVQQTKDADNKLGVPVVSMILADRRIDLGEIAPGVTLTEEKLRELFLNTYGDLFHLPEGEAVEYVGVLNDFFKDETWQ